jgi:hypothetical protein
MRTAAHISAPALWPLWTRPHASPVPAGSCFVPGKKLPGRLRLSPCQEWPWTRSPSTGCNNGRWPQPLVNDVQPPRQRVTLHCWHGVSATQGVRLSACRAGLCRRLAKTYVRKPNCMLGLLAVLGVAHVSDDAVRHVRSRDWICAPSVAVSGQTAPGTYYLVHLQPELLGARCRQFRTFRSDAFSYSRTLQGTRLVAILP